MNVGRLAGSCLAASVLIPGPAHSTDPDAVIRSLLQQDAAVADVGERLSVAAAALCLPTGWTTGIVVQSLTQYGADYRGAAARLLGLGDRPTIVHVVSGSAAERAGIRTGDAILAIDGMTTAVATYRTNRTNRTSMADTQRTLDLLNAELADGEVMLRVSRDGAIRDVRVQGVRACPARFEVRPGGSANASAGRDVVQVSSELVDSARADSDLAPLIAHELSHIVLRHADTLRRHQGGLLPGFGKGGAALRAGEIAADRLSVYLLALAGYRPDDAISFWSRFGRATDQGILSDRTHPGWKQRVAAIRQEVARVAAQRAAGESISPPADLLAPPYR